MRPAWALLVAILLPACDLGSAAVISETEAAQIITKRLATFGYTPSATDHAITNLDVCDQKTGGCETVTFTLDGWDPAQRVGFEYLAAGDPELTATSGYGHSFWPDAVQDALKQKNEGEVILVIREVSHETRELALEALEDEITRRLQEYGVGK